MENAKVKNRGGKYFIFMKNHRLNAQAAPIFMNIAHVVSTHGTDVKITGTAAMKLTICKV